MRVKARKHVQMKGLDGSNPPLSATQSVDVAFNLEVGENFARKAGFIAPVAHRRRWAYAGFSRFGRDPLRTKQKRFASPQRAGFSPGHRRSPQARDFNWSDCEKGP